MIKISANRKKEIKTALREMLIISLIISLGFALRIISNILYGFNLRNLSFIFGNFSDFVKSVAVPVYAIIIAIKLINWTTKIIRAKPDN